MNLLIIANAAPMDRTTLTHDIELTRMSARPTMPVTCGGRTQTNERHKRRKNEKEKCTMTK